MSDDSYPADYGWDLSMACIVTDAIVPLIAFPSAFLIRQRYANSNSSVINLLVNVFTFATLALGMEFGFGGLCHAMLRSNFIAGKAFSTVWGEGAWMWMLAWAAGMVTGGVAAGGQLVLGFSWAQFSTNWSTAAMALSLLVSAGELYQSITDIQKSGFYVSGWSKLCFAAAAIVVLSRGCTEKGAASFAVGCASTIGGFMVLLTAPATCSDYDNEEQVTGNYGPHTGDCPYPAYFNHNSVFHVLVIIGMVISLAGITQKLDEEARADYLNMLHEEEEHKMRQKQGGMFQLACCARP